MVRDYLRYYLFSILVFVCQVLPLRFLYWIALRLADLAYFVTFIPGREAVRANLREVLPEATRQRITYETRWIFRNFGKYLVEFFSFRRFDKHFFNKHLDIRGREHIDRALALGRGCLIVSGHMSNWELGAAGMCHAGYAVSSVVAMHRASIVNRLFMREREAVGVKVIDTESAGMGVMHAMKRNEVVCILGDRDVTGQGVEVEFFGKPVRFPQGPARLALATGAALVPGFVERRTNDSFTIHFGPALAMPEEGTREEKVGAIMRAYARALETRVRWRPEEWGVFYRVWEEEWQA